MLQTSLTRSLGIQHPVIQAIRHFLLVYDANTRRVTATREFADAEVSVALDEYQRLETQYREAPEIQVLLISADSLETVKQTHSNFFTADSFEHLRELVSAG